MAKYRGGFVSNSSSSSFIIMADKGMDVTFENVAQMMFPDKDPSRIGFSNYGDGISGIVAVGHVTRDMVEAGVADDGKLMENINSLNYGDFPVEFNDLKNEEPDYDKTVGYGSKLSDEERRKRWQEYDSLMNAWRKKVADRIRASGCDVYIVEYSDNDGQEMSTMEHGGVFDSMIYRGRAMRFSNH